MPDGTVGGGHQNNYKEVGILLCEKEKKKLRYTKGINRGRDTDRKDRTCWNAGTPVRHPANPDYDKIMDGKLLQLTTSFVPIEPAEAGEVVEVLTTMKDDTEEPVGYHPLIQFYNQILADLIKDDMMVDMKNLEDPKSAGRVWQYFEHYYVKKPKTDGDPDKFLAMLHAGQKRDGLRKPELVKENGSN